MIKTEGEKYIQDELPGSRVSKHYRDYISVFLPEERKIRNLSYQEKMMDLTTEVIWEEKKIHKSQIFFNERDIGPFQRPLIVAKIEDKNGGKIEVFSLSKGLISDSSNRKNDREYCGHIMPRYLLANCWLENPDIKFAPWNLESMGEMKYFIRGNLEGSIEEIGGKAFGLARLKKHENLGFKVPEFVVIPTSFCKKLKTFGFFGRSEEIISSFASPEDIMRQDGVDGPCGLDSREVPHGIEQMFDSYKLEEGMFEQVIRDNLERELKSFVNIDKNGLLIEKIILRSSSPLEDSSKTKYQFQGVFESDKPQFSLDDVYGSLKKIYLSPWSSYAEFYLRNRELAGKVERDVAVIVQKIPEDYKYVCRVFYENGKVNIEYVSTGEYISSDFVGLKATIDVRGNIISRKDVVEDHFYADQMTKMPVKEMLRIARVMKRLSKVYSEYNGKFNAEVLAGGESLNFVQLRETVSIQQGENVPDINQIDIDKVFVDFTAETNNFSIGEVVGPVVNLLGHKEFLPNDRGGKSNVYTDLDDFYQKAEMYNKIYPGAIFIVDMDFGGGELINEKFHMLTANKGGLVTCERYDTSLRCPHFIAEMYNDPCFHVVNVLPEPFEDLKTGTFLGVVSNGQKARFYYPDEGSILKKIFSPPTESQRSYKKKGKYTQGELIFDSNDDTDHKEISL